MAFFIILKILCTKKDERVIASVLGFISFIIIVVVSLGAYYEQYTRAYPTVQEVSDAIRDAGYTTSISNIYDHTTLYEEKPHTIDIHATLDKADAIRPQQCCFMLLGATRFQAALHALPPLQR